MLNSVNNIGVTVENENLKLNSQPPRNYLNNDNSLEKDTVSFKQSRRIPTQKTHAGLITGVIAGLFVGGFNALKFKLTGYKHAKTIGLLTLVSSITCGALVDSITNKKRKEFAFINRGKSQKEILLGNERAEVSRAGEIYYNTNTGKKHGAMLGAIIFPLVHLIRREIQPKDIQNLTTPLQECLKGSFRGALSGFLMGAIADGCSNNSAAKFADAVAFMNNEKQKEECNPIVK